MNKNSIKIIALAATSLLINTNVFADNIANANYYKNYYQRAIKIVIPDVNAQEEETELNKPTDAKQYAVPELKTDSNAIANAKARIGNNAHKSNNRTFAKNRLSKIPQVPLSFKANKGLILSEKFINEDDFVQPGIDGVVRFQYGRSQPVLVCAPLQVCAILLDKDEVVTGHQLGDPMNWTFTTPQNGNNTIVLKPNTSNVNTNVLIFTMKNGARRQYSIKLVAHTNRYMPFVGFSYPDDVQAQNAQYYAGVQSTIAKQEKEQIKNNAKYALNTDSLDYRFEVRGSAPFKIDRVYTDGIKTFIDLKTTSKGDELPVFMAETSDKKDLMTNYMYDADKNRYVIDYKLKTGYLIAGEDKLKISYKAK
jgi:type IV secretion system protein TrbG